jgi:hypothetical protein
MRRSFRTKPALAAGTTEEEKPFWLKKTPDLRLARHQPHGVVRIKQQGDERRQARSGLLKEAGFSGPRGIDAAPSDCSSQILSAFR